jgi:2-hydroxychromene-2-carboxylate isomerase
VREHEAGGSDILTVERQMPSTIRFYFDYVSPNAYLAWTQLPALANRYGATIEPVPVLFAGLLEATGQLGPAEVPAKIRWMHRNNLRKAARLGIAINPPVHHPFNPLLALRVSSLPLETARRAALIGALFEAVWVRGLHVSEASVVEQVADELALPGASLVADAQSSSCKSALRDATSAAIARGVFGVPTMEVGDELFWGFDDFAQLEGFLAGSDPLDPSEWERWSGPARPSAVRARSGRKPEPS